MYSYYPGYLLVSYAVEERRYEPKDEPAWLAASIRQIRDLGSHRFSPQFEWVAVVIRNSAEHKGVDTFTQSYKVGAIFRARDVFDRSLSPNQLAAQAAKDRSPFQYDPAAPEKRSQRWLIVERHMSTTRPSADGK
jgi:hypothetical protein